MIYSRCTPPALHRNISTTHWDNVLLCLWQQVSNKLDPVPYRNVDNITDSWRSNLFWLYLTKNMDILNLAHQFFFGLFLSQASHWCKRCKHSVLWSGKTCYFYWKKKVKSEKCKHCSGHTHWPISLPNNTARGCLYPDTWNKQSNIANNVSQTFQTSNWDSLCNTTAEYCEWRQLPTDSSVGIDPLTVCTQKWWEYAEQFGSERKGFQRSQWADRWCTWNEKYNVHTTRDAADCCPVELEFSSGISILMTHTRQPESLLLTKWLIQCFTRGLPVSMPASWQSQPWRDLVHNICPHCCNPNNQSKQLLYATCAVCLIGSVLGGKFPHHTITLSIWIFFSLPNIAAFVIVCT